MKKYFLLLIIATSILTSSCNSEGGGIFFQISQEIKQISSEISELAVHQVLEVGSTVYARTGRKIWVQSGTSWSDVSKGNYIYNIVEYGGDLYGNINNDDNDLDNGKIMSFSGSSWDTTVYTSSTNLTLFEANDNYIVIEGVNIVTDVLSSTTGVASANFTSSSLNGVRIVDGASNGTQDLFISSSKIYEDTFGAILSEQTVLGAATGILKGITVSNTNLFYLSNSIGQIFVSDAIGQAWTLAGTISDAIPTEGSLDVVTVDGGANYYLIIGTNNGFYEMKIGTTTITVPSATTSISDFDTSYPELATSLIYEVYPSATANVFYLATSNGLWKRNTDGTFAKQ